MAALFGTVAILVEDIARYGSDDDGPMWSALVLPGLAVVSRAGRVLAVRAAPRDERLPDAQVRAGIPRRVAPIRRDRPRIGHVLLFLLVPYALVRTAVRSPDGRPRRAAPPSWCSAPRASAWATALCGLAALALLGRAAHVVFTASYRFQVQDERPWKHGEFTDPALLRPARRTDIPRGRDGRRGIGGMPGVRESGGIP